MRFVLVSFLLAALLAALSAESTNNSEVHTSDDWWRNGLFYQIYPRSFKDSNDDGIGDINGITEKLDYLKELGVNGVWLSPIFKSPMVDFGYDISNFTEIDKIFGNIDDLKHLISEASKKGIAIILDFVPNHTSDQCEWFKKSAKREPGFENFYIWHDGGKNQNGSRTVPNNWLSVFHGSAWTWHEERKQYYLHQFAKEQPDLNFRESKVIDAMKKVLEFWLEIGVAGFRIDSLVHLFEDIEFRNEPLKNNGNSSHLYKSLDHIYTTNLPQNFEILNIFRNFTEEWHKNHNSSIKPILMTEAYVNTTEYVKYFGTDDLLGAQMPFNFVLMEKVNKSSTAVDFKNVIDERLNATNETLNWVIGNHDRPRVGSRFGPEKVDGLLTLVMTLPGIAVTYMGEEIGMLDNRDGISFNETQDPPAKNVGKDGPWKEFSRDPIRTPFQWNSEKYAGFMSSNSTKKPWLPIHPNYIDINVDIEQNASHSTLKFYKELVQLRSYHAFAGGSFKSMAFNDHVFGYVRSHNGHENYVVLINFGNREERVNVTELTTALGKTSWVTLAGADSHVKRGDQFDTDSIVLGKNDVVILTSSSAINAVSVLGLLVVSIARSIF